jgi:hypothetical protein
MKCEFSSCPEWDKCPFDHKFNGNVRELQGRVSSIFVCQDREKPHKYACNIFQDETLFPPIEGSIRKGLIAMGGAQIEITYCPQCETEGKNLIPIQNFLDSELRPLLTQIKVKSEKSEIKREEEAGETYQDIYDDFDDNNRKNEIQITAQQVHTEKDELDTSDLSSENGSLISIPIDHTTDHTSQTIRKSFLEDSKSITYDFDLWIKIVDTEREKKLSKLTLSALMQRMICLLARVTHYTENALVPLPEIIEPNDSKNEVFATASIDECLFWERIFNKLKEIQPQIPYLSFSSLLVNNLNLNTLILDLDGYCTVKF